MLFARGIEDMENVPPPPVCGSHSLTCATAVPRKTGSVYMIQGRRKVRVKLSVYSGQFELFAVISQDKVICKDSGYINLRHCTIREVGQNGFQVYPPGCDGNILNFNVPSAQDTKAWIQALSPSSQSQRQSEASGRLPRRSAFEPKKNRTPLGLNRGQAEAGRMGASLGLPALQEECGEE